MEFGAKQKGHLISNFFILAPNYKVLSVYLKTEFDLVSVYWRSWLRHCVTSSQVRFPMGSLGFFIDLILPAAPWPWDGLWYPTPRVQTRPKPSDL
jgi:hypothetical protein